MHNDFFLFLLNDIKLFMGKKGRNIEEFNDESWIINVAFLVDVTDHLHNLHEELQALDKLITNICNTIKAFKVKL
jgi:hypothetical protein